jgi:hypothetical protein
MHKPKQDGNNNPGIAIDFFCGSGGFAAEVYISSFVVWLILLLGAYHARHFYSRSFAVLFTQQPVAIFYCSSVIS